MIKMESIINDHHPLLEHLDQIHTTNLGVERIKRNLSLQTEDVVSWCIDQIKHMGCVIERKGKNWYVSTGQCVLTINAYSYTIITAHKK